MKPLQLAHAYEIISHALNKCLQNNGRGGGSDELPADICKQVCSLAKDKATQLSSQMNDGKCNWLLLSSVMQTLNYLKIIYAKNSQHFTLDAQLMQSFTKITGKNRKKLPKPGQIALKGLLSGYVVCLLYSLSLSPPSHSLSAFTPLQIEGRQEQQEETCGR